MPKYAFSLTLYLVSLTFSFTISATCHGLRWQSESGNNYQSNAVTYVTPGLRTKIRFCQVIAEDLLFTGTITEGTTVCQYVNTETQDVQVSSTYKVRVIGILLPKLF